jgi:hypothetical protein
MPSREQAANLAAALDAAKEYVDSLPEPERQAKITQTAKAATDMTLNPEEHGITD